jgi:glutathione S-transferase
MPTLTYAARDASKAQPKLKLTYFDGAGRAAPIRQALVIGGIAFEDERLSFQEWGAKKAEGFAKFGQLPILEIDGQQLAQSQAILLYAGSLAGLTPTEPLALARVSETLNLLEDVGKLSRNVFMASDDAAKATARQAFTEDLQQNGLPKVEKQLGDNQFFAGSELSVADLAVLANFENITSPMIGISAEDTIQKFPKLVEFADRVKATSQYQEWTSKKQA